MSALNTLSIVSNVFQVVSFADTVFRAGKNLYDLLDKVRSASRNIALLLLDLQALLSVVAYVRVFVSEHASSPFSRDDGHTLPNVHTVLMLIEQDFRHLTSLVGQVVNSGHGGWLSQLQINFRWALKDDEIAASRCRLTQYTQNLTAALCVSGRRNDIVLRTKLQNIEDRLLAISQNPPQRLDTELDTPSASTRSDFRAPRRQDRANSSRIQPRSGPTINIYENEDQSLILDTGNYQLTQIIKPAMLLQDLLIRSFDAMPVQDILSEAQAEHLQMLFNFLLATAHAASAEVIMGKYKSSSATKLRDPVFAIDKWKNTEVECQNIDSSGAAKRPLPTSLEEKSLTLNTSVGLVRAKILSARSSTESRILAFDFAYLGDAQLGLSSFAVRFMSDMREIGSPLRYPKVLPTLCMMLNVLDTEAENNKILDLLLTSARFGLVFAILRPAWPTNACRVVILS